MSQPSVTKAFSATIAPSLHAMGFCSDGPKRYRRICGDVCQSIFLHVESRGRREFNVEYSAILIAIPHTYDSLQFGGKFPVGSRGASYRADTPEHLERSILVVQSQMEALLDWFRACESLTGFLAGFADHIASQPLALRDNGHCSFTQAVGFSLLHDFDCAKRYAEKALSEFRRILSDFQSQYPTATHWAPDCISQVQALREALDTPFVDSLLTDWRGLTVAALNLNPRSAN